MAPNVESQSNRHLLLLITTFLPSSLILKAPGYELSSPGIRQILCVLKSVASFFRVFNWTLVAASSHKVGHTICSGGAQDQSEFQKGKETESLIPGEGFHREAN